MRALFCILFFFSDLSVTIYTFRKKEIQQEYLGSISLPSESAARSLLGVSLFFSAAG